MVWYYIVFVYISYAALSTPTYAHKLNNYLTQYQHITHLKLYYIFRFLTAYLRTCDFCKESLITDVKFQFLILNLQKHI